VGGADLGEVGVEVRGPAALGEQRTDRLVDQPHRLGVGALVFAGDRALDVAAVDGECVLSS
jgi:hypothetical protein